MPEEVSGGERANLVPHINKAFDREVTIIYISKDMNRSYGDWLSHPHSIFFKTHFVVLELWSSPDAWQQKP